MDSKLNISLIGLGRWGKNHLRVLHDNLSDKVNITVYDSNVGALCDAKDNYSKVKIAESLDDAIDSTEATIIATPSDSHFWIARQAISSRNDVMIEKPATQTMSGSSTLIDDVHVASITRRKPIIMVDHILLYNPAVKLVSDVISSGELGAITSIRADRTHFGWKVPSENVITSLMIHDIYLSEHILDQEIGKISHVSAINDFDDVTVSGRMRDGATLSFRSSWMHYSKQRTVQLVGTKKTLVWDDEEKTITLFPYSITGGDIIRDSHPRHLIDASGGIEPLEGALRHFINCVKTREEPLSGLVEGRKAIFTCNGIKHMGEK